jgi:hypothetical protein
VIDQVRRDGLSFLDGVKRLDPCRFANIFARFDGVFERIGQGRILLGFHHP